MIRYILAATLFALPSLTAAQDTPSPETPPATPPATVVVAFNNDNVWPVIVEGVRNRDTGEPVQANDPVRIASISKLIMAMATLRLVDEGKVDLDVDVSTYLGWQLRSPDFPDAEVTLAQLLSHRAGLRDNAGYVIPLGESLEAKLSDPDAWYADAPPGEAPFKYANLGSPVVATVLEAATGERYDRLLERTVFAPADAKACVNWIGCDEDMVARAVTLYRDTGEIARDDPADLPPNCTFPVADGVECSLDDYVPGTNASVFSPQGGVRIGMMDLAKIVRATLPKIPAAWREGKAFGEFYRLIFDYNESETFFCSYSMGLHSIQRATNPDCDDYLFADGRLRIGHVGEAYGLRAGVWLAPIAPPGIVYFTTAVPPRQSAEDEGGFDQREIELMARAQELLAQDR